MFRKPYTDSDIIRFSAEVNSMAELLGKLGLKAAGGNYANIKRKLQRLNLTCEHWGGQGWSKDKQLKDWSTYTRVVHLKKHLIKLRGHKCERCLNTEWLEEPITLEVHHVDGDRTFNDLINLQLLCPNCHSKTPNWRNKK